MSSGAQGQWQVGSIRPPSMHYRQWQQSMHQVENSTPPPLDEYDADAAPDLVGEVLGWRSWRVTPQGDLISANGHSVWRPGINRAVCGGIDGEHDHPAPQEKCACGFYGLHEAEEGEFEGEAVRGIFRAWGKIIVHPTGLRSEWAEIVCLIASKPSTKIVRASLYYDVPLLLDAEEALAYAREQGHDVIPEKLRPEMPEPEDVNVTAWQRATASYISSRAPIPHFQTGGAVFPTATLTTKPSKPKPGKKSLPRAAFFVPWAIGWLVWGAAWLVAPWLFFAAVALFVGANFMVPIYRLALRLRCLWREMTRWGSGWHDPTFMQARDRRIQADLVKGDRCPECGWKLRREEP